MHRWRQGVCNHNRRKARTSKVGNHQLARSRQSALGRQMIGLQPISLRNRPDCDTRHQRLGDDPTLHRIRPAPLASRPGQNLHPAHGLQMVLTMDSQSILPRKTTWATQSQITLSGRRWGRRTAYNSEQNCIEFHVSLQVSTTRPAADFGGAFARGRKMPSQGPWPLTDRT